MNVKQYMKEQLALHEAAVTILREHPGCETLGDVGRSTGQDVGDLLADRTGLPRSVVWEQTGL
jgi:hypothetical protein